jgi:hypothetical protein
MEQFPSSPSDVIDPRWSQAPRATAPTPHVGGRRSLPDPDLDGRLRAIVEPWQAGRVSATDTLKAFRSLANEVL